jgi:ATPases with chaperone activity, ATP-binding subunit
MDNDSLIAKYTTNLTEQIIESPEKYVISGRDREIKETIVALMRGIKNSPLLIGEPGVGKTAIVEGLAKMILDGQVPARFIGKQVLSLQLAALVGEEFTQDLAALIEALRIRDDVIVFIDEIHMLVGAGDNDGSMDAANILKPALSRGYFPVIGATTLDEYFEYIEPDGALTRRFVTIKVDEPSADNAIAMLQNTVVKRLSQTHGLLFEPGTVEMSVHGSIRYMPTEFLPDKAINLIDSAGSRVALAGRQLVTVEDIVNEIEYLTGVPASSIRKTDAERIKGLRAALNANVIGQMRATNAVVRAIKRNVADLSSTSKPIASFLFLGPTGTGKTELVKQLAAEMFDSADNLMRFDMSEYNGDNPAGRFIVDATKAVGRTPYGILQLDEIEKADRSVFDLLLQVLDDGHLTNSRGKTFSFRNLIIIATSNLGYELLTDNRALVGETRGEFTEKDLAFEKLVRGELQRKLRPEFVNRWSEIVVFNFLEYDDVVQIASLALANLAKRFKQEHDGIELRADKSVAEFIANVGYDELNGARPINRQIETRIIDLLSDWVIQMSQDKHYDDIQAVTVTLDGDKPVGTGFNRFDKRKLHLTTIFKY